MSQKSLTFKTELPFPLEEVFAWHLRTGACNRLIPPWEKIKVLKHPQTVTNGADVTLRCDLSGFFNFNYPYFNWHLRHENLELNKSFSDLQIKGPFKFYKHQHLFSQESGKTILTDHLEYELPFSSVTQPLAENLINKKLSRTFSYRDSILKNDLEFHRQFSSEKKLNFLISGATGMLGNALCAFLTTGGHRVSRIVRNKKDLGPNDFLFDGQKIEINNNAEFDCVVNLAGANIADSPWSDTRKQELIDSRVGFTEILINTVKTLRKIPESFISASALGFYNNKTGYNENSPKGVGFLSDLSDLWEQQAHKASEIGMSVKIVRFGVVVDPSGGALKKMLPAFICGLGGKLGSGQQKFSWISLDDALRAILFIATKKNLGSTFNICSPKVITNLEVTKTLSTILKRPSVMSVPEKVLKAIFGQMAEETMLMSSDCKPEALLKAGYNFLYPDFDQLICYCLGRNLKEFC